MSARRAVADFRGLPRLYRIVLYTVVVTCNRQPSSGIPDYAQNETHGTSPGIRSHPVEFSSAKQFTLRLRIDLRP